MALSSFMFCKLDAHCFVLQNGFHDPISTISRLKKKDDNNVSISYKQIISKL